MGGRFFKGCRFATGGREVVFSKQLSDGKCPWL